MDGFRKAVKAAMGDTVDLETVTEGTKIMGAAAATAEQMVSYIKGKNPDVAQSVLDMILRFSRYIGSEQLLWHGRDCQRYEGELLRYSADGNPGTDSAFESLWFDR